MVYLKPVLLLIALLAYSTPVEGCWQLIFKNHPSNMVIAYESSVFAEMQGQVTMFRHSTYYKSSEIENSVPKIGILK